MKLKRAAAVVTATLMAGSVMAGAAYATNATNGGSVPSNAAAGVLEDSAGRSTDISNDGVALTAPRGEVAVKTFDLTYGVGATSGWHSHPGIVIATVVEGTVTQTVGCRKRDTERFTVGDTFYEVGLHLVKNVSDKPAVLKVTRIFPQGKENRTPLNAAGKPSGRIDEKAPKCRHDK